MAYNERPKVKGMNTGGGGAAPKVSVKTKWHPPQPEPDEETKPYVPTITVSASADSGYGPIGDSEYQKVRKEKDAQTLKFLSKHPALTNDKLAAALTRHAIRKQTMIHQARMMEDEAHDMPAPELGEPNTKITKKKGGYLKGNPYEMVQKGGGVVVKNSQTGKVHGTFATKREAAKQFRLLEGIEHGWSPTGKK